MRLSYCIRSRGRLAVGEFPTGLSGNPDRTRNVERTKLARLLQPLRRSALEDELDETSRRGEVLGVEVLVLQRDAILVGEERHQLEDPERIDDAGLQQLRRAVPRLDARIALRQVAIHHGLHPGLSGLACRAEHR